MLKKLTILFASVFFVGVFTQPANASVEVFKMTTTLGTTIEEGKNLIYSVTCSDMGGYTTPAAGSFLLITVKNVTRGGTAYGGAITDKNYFDGPKPAIGAVVSAGTNQGNNKRFSINLKYGNAKAGDKVEVMTKCYAGSPSDSYWADGAVYQTKTLTVTTKAKTAEELAAEARAAEVKAQLTALETKLTEVGFVTPDISELPEAQAKAYAGLTLESKDNGKVTFVSKIDLLAENLKTKLPNIGDFIKITNGKLVIDCTQLPELKGTIDVDLYNLNFTEKSFKVVADGKEVESATDTVLREDGTEVSPATYNGESKILSLKNLTLCNVAVSPNLSITNKSEDSTTNDEKYVISGNVADTDAVIMIDVNGSNEEVELNEKGEFSKDIKLKPGSNEIKVKATSTNGESEEQVIKVVFNSSNIAPIIIGIVLFLLLIALLIAAVVIMRMMKARRLKQTSSISTSNSVEEVKAPVTEASQTPVTNS